MPPIPAAALAPPDLATPFTASAAPSAVRACLFERADIRQHRIDKIEIGKFVGEDIRVREAGIFVLGRDACHCDRAFGERIRAIAVEIVGGHNGLALSDQDTQAHVVALGAFAFLDLAVAHLDRKRDRAHRDRVGGIRAGLAGSGDKALGESEQRRLIEKV